MIFWALTLLLATVAVLFVALPLWRHARDDGHGTDRIRRETNLSLYQQRQLELDTELQAGTLDQQQYEALLLELKKMLLDDTGTGKGSAGPADRSAGFSAGTPGIWSRLVPLLMMVLVPLLTYWLYDRLGAIEDVELRDLYERSLGSGEDQQEARDLVVALGRVVQEDPANEWAWYFLARNFSNLGMFNEAEIGFQQASELMPDGADKAATLGFLAQIRYLNNGGALTAEVLATIEQARAINPAEMASLQLLALDAELARDYQAAIGYWRLMIQANPNSLQAQELRARITEAQGLIAQQSGIAAAPGPRIEVNLSLAEGLALPGELRVFVTARSAEQQGTPPLAVTDLTVADLPSTVLLDDSLAMTPAFSLSSSATVYVTAAVSLTGSANVQPGDYRVVSENFAHNGQHTVIDLVISEPVP